MILTHLGFSIGFINLIMGCISNVSFVVPINEASSPFFHSQRGLRQGCQLSPLLFLLVVVGISQLIVDAKRRGKIKGIEVAINMYINHLIFVDDILLFIDGSRIDIPQIKSSLNLFLVATGMCINPQKSSLVHEGFSRIEITKITSVLHLKLRR